MLRPKTASDLAGLVREAKAPFELVGTGTKRALGRPTNMQMLDLSAFNAILAYEPEELILDVGAAVRLKDIERLLTSKNQMLAFEPPDFSKLLATKQAGTLGGALACNLSGPRRIKAGAARDHVLGITAVNGQGEIFKSGARVVKNVTGYDVPRLMAGSYGTLAAFTSIIFKVLPRPETEMTLLSQARDDAAALTLMTMALQSPCEVSAAAFLPGRGVALRLEGIPASITYRRDKLANLLSFPSEILNGKDSAALWVNVRDVEALAAKPDDHIWRISVAPQETPHVIAQLKRQFTFRHLLDWGGGLIWLAHEAGTDHSAAVRQAAAPGHATLFHADAETRAQLEVFQPLPPPLAALTSRVKQAFDPKGLFNPGRMYRNI
jgi:glycolate oxidase FAD binding subunit